MTLFDPPPRARRRPGPLVPIDPRWCPDCFGPVVEFEWHEPALLWHGGYGADLRFAGRECRSVECGWALLTEVSDTRPRRRYRAPQTVEPRACYL